MLPRLKIEPDLPDTPELGRRLLALGFRTSPQRVQPLSTIVIDLSVGDEFILAQMKPKWRYNIRLAEKRRCENGGARRLMSLAFKA